METIAPRIGNDIALILLARPWSGQTATLSLSKPSDPPDHKSVEAAVAGYGATEYKQHQNRPDPIRRADNKGDLYAGSASLLQAFVPTVSISQCAARYSGYNVRYNVGDKQICAGLEVGGRDSCQGDSGGPLMATSDNGARQIGIVSWGIGCAKAQYYGVYTRISRYSDWIQSRTGPLRGAPGFRADEALTKDQLARAVAHLDDLLGTTKGRVEIGVRGGNSVKLGDRVNFDAASQINGRLLIMDIDANRKVTLLYPNKYTPDDDPGHIKAGKSVAVPGPDYPGFTAFKAQEPTGKGRLIAIVAPDDFDIKRFAATQEIRVKGFSPVNETQNYFMQIINQIETYLGLDTRSSEEVPMDLSKWGLAVTEYEIRP